METIDTLVIGAGVVGLACARALAELGHEVVVVEQALGIGQGVSSRNSEVIHAGIYYPSGSLKARHCVRGRDMLYAYCASHGVAHRRCGKLIVATQADHLSTLSRLKQQAEANGVMNLQWLDAAAVQQREPALRALQALWSPDSGIVDSHALMLALQGDLERAGGVVALGTRVISLHPFAGRAGLIVETSSSAVTHRADSADHADHAEPAGSDPRPTQRWHARQVVNAAGLYAVALARASGRSHLGAAQGQHAEPTLQTIPPWPWPQAHYARGRYFALTRPAPFSHLVYPVPEPGGLGVHLTLDLAGQARFGPDVQWMPEACDASPQIIDRFDYAVDIRLQERFAREISAYWPGLSELPADALQPAYSGIRPKLSGPGEAAADFVIAGPQEHGQSGVVHLMGIESPGLTSALSIASDVAHKLAEAHR